MKIKVIDSIDHELEGKLPEDMMGNIYSVVEEDEKGLWVEHFGEKALILKGEYEVFEGIKQSSFEIVGNVVECEDTSRYGTYYDVSNEKEDLTHLLEKYHGKKVKVTVEVIE